MTLLSIRIPTRQQTEYRHKGPSMNQLRMTVVASVLVALMGCQSTPKEPQQASQTNQEQQQANVEFEKVKDTHTTWTKNLSHVDDLKIYSPTTYKTLLKAWNEASDLYKVMEKNPTVTLEDRSFFSSQSYAKAYDEKIIAVDAAYKKLEQLKAKADVLLADSIAQMNQLDSIFANRHFPDEYRSLLSDYQELFDDVADDELEDAQENQVEFLANGRKLEIKVEHKVYISPLEQELYVLKREEFNTVAPMTFSAAQSEVQLASNVVAGNPRDKVAIKAAVAKARFEIQHVKQVTHQVKVLAAIEDGQFENYVLDTENQLLTISKAIDGSDFRDVVFREQAEKVLEQVKKLRSADKTDLLLDKLNKSQAKTEQLLSDNNKLTAELKQQHTLSSAYQNQIEQQTKLIERLEQQLNSKSSPAAYDAADTTTAPSESNKEVSNKVDAPVEATAVATPAVATDTPVTTSTTTNTSTDETAQ